MWKLEFTSQALKQLHKFDIETQKRLRLAFREKLLVEPELYLIPLRGDKKGRYKFRVGNYRCICKKFKESYTIISTEIAHRKDVYR